MGCFKSPQDDVEADLELDGTNEAQLREEQGHSSEKEHQTPRRYPQRPQRQHHPPVRLTYDQLGSSLNTFSWKFTAKKVTTMGT